jgi:hypothetical protein
MEADAEIMRKSAAVSLSSRIRVLPTNLLLSLITVLSGLCGLGVGVATVATRGSTFFGCLMIAAGILGLRTDPGIASESDTVSLPSRRRALLIRSLLSVLFPL